MARNFKIHCPHCNKEVHIIEHPMNVPGGKEKEEAICPFCGELVYSAMTDGWFDVYLVKD